MYVVVICSVFCIIINSVSAQRTSNLERKDPLLFNELKVLKKCSHDVGNSLVIPEELRLGYNNNNSAKTLENPAQVLGTPLFEFSLVTEEPNCKSGTFNVTVSTANNGTLSLDVDDEIKELSFTAEGAVSYRVDNSKRVKHIIFHRENYCISGITEEQISLNLCKSQCFAHDDEAGDNVCVSRCCPPGKISSVQGFEIQTGCVSVDGTDWHPDLYADGNLTTPESQVYPQIVIAENPEEWYCSTEERFRSPVRKSEIRILPDGRILWLNTDALVPKWVEIWSEKEPVPYCLDEYQDPLRPHLNHAMIVLKKCLTQSEIREREELSKYNEDVNLMLKLEIFLVYIPCILIYLVICIIYLSIWDKHQAHGWIVLGFSTSQLLYIIFFSTKKALLAFTEDVLSHFTPRNRFCYLIGIFGNFCNIFQYSWAVVITFDLWKTLSSCRPESSQCKGKRIAAYFSFAVGIPAFIVLVVAVPLEYLTTGEIVVTPGYRYGCGVDDGLPYILYIIIPNIILYIPNLVFAGLTFRTLRVAKRNALKMRTSKKKETTGSRATLMAKLIFVMGFSLIFDVALKIAYARTNGTYPLFLNFMRAFRLLQAIGLFWTFVCGQKTQEHLREKFPSLFQIFKRSGHTANNSELGGVRTGMALSPLGKMAN